MEVIDNRYRLLELLEQSEYVSTYLAIDMLEGNRYIQLYLLKSEYTPEPLVDFYRQQYIPITNLDSKLIARNYHFGKVSFTDNKVQTDNIFFYTAEHNTRRESFLSFIGKLTPEEVIDKFIELCTAVHYLHVNGFVYGAINPHTIHVVEDGDNAFLQLKDLATVELEKYTRNNIDYSNFILPRALVNDNYDIEADMFALGTILLWMLNKETSFTSPSEVLYKIENEVKVGGKYSVLFKEILPIIGKLISTEGVYPYHSVHEMIVELANTLGREISILNLETMDRLHFFTKHIGRDMEKEIILRNVKNLIDFQTGKRTFFIHGENGIGKTRFLQEMEFLLSLEKVKVFASYQLKPSGSGKQLWLDIIQKLMSYADQNVIRKYRTELLTYFPELDRREAITSHDYLLEGNYKYRILNRISSFIQECIRGNTAVMIIDDLHLADGFTLELLRYLSTNIVHHNNLMFILSGEVREDSVNTVFLENIELLKMRTDASVIRLNPLTKEETAQFIKHILSLSYKPIKLTEKIYSRSYGNPLVIQEFIKDLYVRNILKVSPNSGMWSVQLSTLNYDSLDIPDSIEQALRNQLNELSKHQIELMKAVAIFHRPIPIERIATFLSLEKSIVEQTIEELIKKGIFQRLVSDNGYFYEFQNKMLKQIAYEGIVSEDRIKMHHNAAIILENEKEIKVDELIYHYEGAEDKQKCRKLYLEIANDLHERHELKTEIQYLEKAVMIIVDKTEQIQLYMKIGELCSEINEMTKATQSYETASKLALEIDDQVHIMKVNLALAALHAALYQFDHVKRYLQKVEKAEDFSNPEFKLEYKRLQAFLLNMENQPDEASVILEEIIQESESPKITANSYMLLGFSSIQHNKTEAAINYYKKAIELIETTGYMKGYLGALNNIGVIYQAYLSEFDTAREYFLRVRDLSEEYGIFETEIRAVSSIGNIYCDSHDFKEAYNHFKYALQKAEFSSSTWVKNHLYNLLSYVCAEMSNYKEAFSYYDEIVDLKKKGILSELETFDFYKTSMNLFQLIGDHELANSFSQKVLEFHHGRDNIYTYTAKAFEIINRLRVSSIEKITELSAEFFDLILKIPRRQLNVKLLTKAAIVLLEEGNYEVANLFIKKLEAFLDDDIPDNLRAEYYYLLGMKKNNEDSIQLLLQSLSLAKNAANRELTAKTLLLLGDYAFQVGKFYNAANYYLEGTELVKLLLQELPDDYHLTYVNSHRFVRGFVRLERIHEWLIGDQVEFVNLDNLAHHVFSWTELSNALQNKYVNAFMEHEKFIEHISDQHMKRYSDNIRNSSDVLLHVTSNTMKNIEIVLRYFTGITLATKGLILMENQLSELEVLLSTDGRREIPTNHNLINRVRQTREVLLIDKKVNNDRSNLISKELQAVLYIPIIQMQGTTHKHRAVLGYIYLETDQLIHNFNTLGIAKCDELMGFLAAMLEKHQLKLSATIDKLTGTLTRKYLDDALQEIFEFSRESSEPFSIIMYDLDRFKQVNDRFGHQIGDNMLSKVSSLVTNSLDEAQIIGRYGGEEFIIILPSLEAEETKRFAEELRVKIASKKLLGDKFEITVSMGIASYPKQGQTVKELIEKADQALYVAKERGRNNSLIWQEDFQVKAKPQNKLSGILTGDDIKDSRNVLAMVELLQLHRKNLSLEEKIYHFLGRIIEISEAQIGYLLIQQGNDQKIYGRRAQGEDWLAEIKVDMEIVNSILLEERGLYMITLDREDQNSNRNGLPEWISILAVPIMTDGIVRGAIYLTTPTRIKEFGADDLNMLNIYSNIFGSM
ncbi:diguanylate cyclase [Ornithinibacillus scapharcae]|uniref:diguanylate cyclase n=1 Tax=Ornithinibacillus scapharcae TaxID=1147159 RepID=UPI000225BC93|nr:diguanylate cyclase [Ornithinibacillus scapharcae]